MSGLELQDSNATLNSGRVKEIQRRGALIVENKDGFDGDYIGGDTEALVGFDEVWKEFA